MSSNDAPYSHIEVERISAALGAEIRGVDLSRPLSDEVKAEIHRAFVDNSVVLFRGQDVDPASQIAFTRLFGAVDQHPLYRSNQIEGFPEVLVIEHKGGKFLNGRNDIWHSDVTFAEQPPLGSVLQCKAGRPGFGDTLFASLTRAFEALSPGMQRLLEPLEALHSAKVLQDRNNAAKENIPVTEIPPPVKHPVVREHPDNGRPTLFVNPAYTVGLDDMRPEESQALLAHLYAHATRPEFCYRHRWNVGDVVMFDNRCLLHYVSVDYGPDLHRKMHRTTAAGDRPYGLGQRPLLAARESA